MTKEQILQKGTKDYCSALYCVEQYVAGNCPLSVVESAISIAMEEYASLKCKPLVDELNYLLDYLRTDCPDLSNAVSTIADALTSYAGAAEPQGDFMSWLGHHSEAGITGKITRKELKELAAEGEKEPYEPDNDLVAKVTALVREADVLFVKGGGSTRHWVREAFLPMLNEAGLQITVASGKEPEKKDPVTLSEDRIEYIKNQIADMKAENKRDHESGEYDRFNWQNQGRIKVYEEILGWIPPAATKQEGQSVTP